jgi:hypothetical protein
VIYIVREASGKLPRIFHLFCFLQFLACFCDVISVWELLFVQNVCLFHCVGCQKHFRGLVWIDCNSENLAISQECSGFISFRFIAMCQSERFAMSEIIQVVVARENYFGSISKINCVARLSC